MPGIGESVVYVLVFIALYFEVFLLVSFLKKRVEKIPPSGVAQTADLPRVSIVVPCFNEESTLASTMHSLLELRYPKELLEIMVVDDGSTDRTLQIAEEFARACPAGGARRHTVRVFHKSNGGKHTALNLAIKHTSAEFIACLDADSTVAPDALSRLLPAFENPKIAAVTPGIHVKNPKTILQHMQKAEYRLSVFVRFILSILGSAFITPGPFSIFRTNVVRELGGWKHGHYTEDMEIALRMQAAGHLIANAPGAMVHTNTPRSLSKLFRQRVRWTYGFLRNAIDYRFMFGSGKFGNLGLIILPSALVSIGTGIYFFIRIIWDIFMRLREIVIRAQITGSMPDLSFAAFYINTSAIWFVVYVAAALVIVFISAGSWLGTGSRRPPFGTPFFILFYSFLVPFWLGAAVVRTIFKTGVQWR